MTTRTNSQRRSNYILLKNKLSLKHNLESVFKCDTVHFNGSYDHCKGNTCNEFVLLSIHHKAIIPQYPASICSGYLTCLLASKKEIPNKNQRIHINYGERIGESQCKPIHLDLSSSYNVDMLSAYGKKRRKGK